MADLENKEVVEEVNAEMAVEEVNAEMTVEEGKKPYADRVAEKKASMKNPFARVCYGMLTYFVIVFLDFIDSFKRNPIKIGAFLIMAPGFLIGFLMDFEIDSLYHTTSADYAPICFFILVLAGMVNIFEAFSIMKLKNFGSILIATILTAVICVVGIVYMVDLLNAINGLNQDIESFNIASFFTIGASMVISIIGCVIAWIFRDREYVKDKF